MLTILCQIEGRLKSRLLCSKDRVDTDLLTAMVKAEKFTEHKAESAQRMAIFKRPKVKVKRNSL